MRSYRIWIIAAGLTGAALSQAQPAPGDQPAPPPPPPDGSAATPQAPPQYVKVSARTKMHASPDVESAVVYLIDTNEQLVPVRTQGQWTMVENWRGQAGWILTARILGAAAAAPEEAVPPQQPPPEQPKAPEKPRPPDPYIDMPQVLNAPTGWLLPAAVLYSRDGLDTGGGVVSDNRVGLGDVAEFGVSTIDQISAKNMLSDNPSRLQPYFAATFRMGVAEDRLFQYQPGLVLGFRKSFERSGDGFKPRIAELTFVASEKLGDRTAIHVGGAFWDASLSDSAGMQIDTLHDRSTHKLADQIRAFGAIEVRPLDKSEIMVAINWAPVFCYDMLTCNGADHITLRPELAWGVRYEVANWIQLESGVRVLDIGKADLLDAQIFGTVTFIGWGLRHAVDK